MKNSTENLEDNVEETSPKIERKREMENRREATRK